MTWRDQLRPASFRGAAFHAVSGTAVFGRRTAQHDYPFRDKPFVEDLGRKAREIQITGFVIGPDYMVARDALVAAAEQPGPGTLVHPHYGEMTVSVTGGVQVSESTAEGGLARITFTCIEAGELTFPSADVSTQDAVAARADNALGALTDGFAARFDTGDLPGWAVADALDRADRYVSTIEDVLGAVAGVAGHSRGSVLTVIAAVRPDLAELIHQPLSLARRLGALTTALREALPARSARSAFGQLATFDAGTYMGATTPTRRREAANRSAFIELARGTAAAEGARALAESDFVDFDDAVAQRDAVVDQLDAVADLTADDGLFHHLSALRAAVVRDVGARGSSLARIARVELSSTKPALVLAYDLYGDATRDESLVERNRIGHPGFLARGSVMEVPVDG